MAKELSRAFDDVVGYSAGGALLGEKFSDEIGRGRKRPRQNVSRQFRQQVS